LPLSIQILGIFNVSVGERDRDNGVILVHAMKEREVRIEAGHGLEGAIPDSVAG
jgi:uncharacterized protein